MMGKQREGNLYKVLFDQIAPLNGLKKPIKTADWSVEEYYTWGEQSAE